MWNQKEPEIAHLLCDARSTPPRVAAVRSLRLPWSLLDECARPLWQVCVYDGKIQYSDMEPSAAVMQQFQRRGDNQIASLEMLAVAFGA